MHDRALWVEFVGLIETKLKPVISREHNKMLIHYGQQSDGSDIFEASSSGPLNNYDSVYERDQFGQLPRHASRVDLASKDEEWLY